MRALPYLTTDLKSFWSRYVRCHKSLMFCALFFLLCSASLTLLLPVAIRWAMDYVFKLSLGDITVYFFVFVLFASLWSVSSALRAYFVGAFSEAIVFSVQKDIFANILRLPIREFEQRHSADFVSLLSTDSALVKATLGVRTTVLLRNLVLLSGALIMMFFTNITLALLVCLALPLVFSLLWLVGGRVNRNNKYVQKMITEVNVSAADQISAIRTLKNYGSEWWAQEKFDNLIEQTFSASKKALLGRSFLSGCIVFCVFSAILLTLWVGGIKVLTGTMTAGELSQFVMYAILAGSSCPQLSGVVTTLTEWAGAVKRINTILTAEDLEPLFLPQMRSQLPKLAGRVTFKDVCFKYRQDEPSWVLKDISFTAQPGETVAFVGSSGAGKSSIFALLQQFYQPAEGQICFDHYCLAEQTPAWARQYLSVVSQNIDIFTGTIADNISFGIKGISQEKIEQAARLAYAHDFISKLPGGYEEMIGERGLTLSGGQKQRIAIARAFLRQAPILLLDEATSALDAKSEEEIQKALIKLKQNSTTLIISHRLATVRQANEILVIEQGRIVERGTHHTLLQQNGVYAKLARLQFAEKAMVAEKLL